MKLFERKKKNTNIIDKIINFFDSCKSSVVNVILSISKSGLNSTKSIDLTNPVFKIVFIIFFMEN